LINIITINWNSSEQLHDLMESIECSGFPDLRVILVNNSPLDLGFEQVVNTYSEKLECHPITNHDNLGYTGGNNIAYQYLVNNNLEGDILIVNPDVVLHSNTIHEMNVALSDGNSAVMVRTLDEHEQVIYDSITLDGFIQKNNIVGTNRIIKTDYVAGSCFLLSRDVIDKVGLFDNRYYLYWEEVELSYRLKFYNYNLVSTTFTHVVRKSNDEDRTVNAYYYYIRNAFLLKNSNYFSCQYFKFVVFIFWVIFLSVVKSIKSFDFRYIYSSIQGLCDGLLSKSGPKKSSD